MVVHINVAMGYGHTKEQLPCVASREVEDEDSKKNIEKDVCISSHLQLRCCQHVLSRKPNNVGV